MKKSEHSQLGTIKLIGNDANFPMWSIIKYIEDTCNNYNKVLLIIRICEHAQMGGSDSELWVAKKSMAPFMNKSIGKSFTFKEDNYVNLATKTENPKLFWHIVINYSRPMVFLRKNNDFIPLVDFIDDEAIKVISFSYNSPPMFDIEGVVNTLVDIGYAGKRNSREEEEHIARQLGESAENYRRIAFASQVINDEKTPEGIRKYANNALADIMLKQEVLNKKLGIRVEKINKRV